MSDTTDTPITDFIFAGWIESHPAKTSHAKLERQLAEAREHSEALKFLAVDAAKESRQHREQIDRIADALRGIRKQWTWVEDPECDCEDCEFCRPIDQALATLDRKEDA